MKSLVIGATGMVGRHILEQLAASGHSPVALSRNAQAPRSDVAWLAGDLMEPGGIEFPLVDVVFCTANANLLANALPEIIHSSLQRLVLFTSTSIVTKIDSNIDSERSGLRKLAEGERRVIAFCEAERIEWTVLRPTMIYDEGSDANVTRLARLVQKFGIIPLAGAGRGMRQPVHAKDLATGALAAAASEQAANKIYALPGGDQITYHEMVGRIFDALNRPRRILRVPRVVWATAFTALKVFFPNANAAMGDRMDKDMIFDPSPAANDFGWSPRPFRPKFPATI